MNRLLYRLSYAATGSNPHYTPRRNHPRAPNVAIIKMMLAWIALFLGSPAASTAVPPELNQYVKKPDATKAWTLLSENGPQTDLELTSQTWQGKPWKHRLTIAQPKRPIKSDIAILYITGDRVDDKDLPFVREWADTARMPVVTLFDVPNQPLYDAREDALIAITFGRYLETKDASWPLLFPMTKSAIAAMDAVTARSKGKIKRFVVCGASKRGWTTWLVAATKDPRVIGIAPMVIDTLNMPRHLAYQKELWGDYSPEIRDYVQTGLTKIIETPDGKKLIGMVDPYSYLSEIKIPTLVITGGNDAYWPVDAHRLYFDQIRGPKFMRVVPNAGHNLNDGREAAASIAYFAGCLAGRIPGGLPKIPVIDAKSNLTQKRQRTPNFVDMRMWTAESENLNFVNSRWENWTQRGDKSKRNEATFAEYRFKADGLEASFTSTVTLTRAGK
jgi:PhoPQ-activated pathogenicity-related protein